MRLAVAFLILIIPGLALAQGAHSAGEATPDRPRSEAALARYPQPVRAGDLAGRRVIEDTQQQAVLGRAIAAARGADGRTVLLMEHGGILGFGTRRILVPLDALALLGQLIVLKDLAPAQLVTLPEVVMPELLPPDTVLRMGLARN